MRFGGTFENAASTIEVERNMKAYAKQEKKKEINYGVKN
jgi:hypothetical protein